MKKDPTYPEFHIVNTVTSQIPLQDPYGLGNETKNVMKTKLTSLIKL